VNIGWKTGFSEVFLVSPGKCWVITFHVLSSSSLAIIQPFDTLYAQKMKKSIIK